MERIIFYIISVLMIIFAAVSVINRNIMRALISLLFVMLGFAGIYFMMNFYFLGAVQMTVYAGGIIILYITSIMLIEKIGQPLDAPKILRQIIAVAISSLGTGVVLFAIYNYNFTIAETSPSTSIKTIGKALINYSDTGYILPFEVVSMLLLAAMVGAIVIAKTYSRKKSTK